MRLVILFLIIPFKIFTQNDTTIVSLVLTHDEAAYIHGALNIASSKLLSAKDKNAPLVDQLNSAISAQTIAYTDSTNVNLKISFSAVKFIINVLAANPWSDVYLLMPKLLATKSD